ncbi:S8 family serine peptidase [Peribacillus sp. SCS-26]|uniref:S8 family serine peptidase n=1 Tax=Paraperibacillus marinus TaxID=3115295 RepID=UPI00390643C6
MLSKFGRLMAPLAMAGTLVSLVPHAAFADENADRRQKSFFSAAEARPLTSKNTQAGVNDREALISSTKPVDKLLKEYKLKLVKQFKSGPKTIYVVRVPENKNFTLFLKAAERHPGVTSAEPNYVKKHLAAALPNDKYAVKQWYLPKLGIPDVWSTYNFKDAVTIAVLDTGVNYTHPDLRGGQILPGYDFVNKDADALDYVGHGTSVAGVIAAQAENKIGIAGITAKNPNIKILPVKIADNKGAEMANLIRGIDFAIKKGANIINISFGSDQPSQAEYEAVRRAVDKGILVVASSGNEGLDKLPVCFPAAYPEVLSVGSTDSKDKRSVFSNAGEALDIAAPGEDIAVTTSRGGYELEAAGTSFSAPIVSGLAGLLLSADKTLKPYELEYMLERSAYKIPSYPNLWNKYTGFGRVDAVKAFQIKRPNLAKDSGDMRASARPAAVNTSYTDKYDTPLDVDWYVLKSAKSMKVRLDVSRVAYTDSIVWTDRLVNGKPVDEKEHDSKGMSLGETFTMDVKPGSNYVQIFEKYNHFSPYAYTIKFTELDTTPPPAPYVYPVTVKSTVLKGKAEKGSTVRLYYGKKLLRTMNVYSAGTFQTTIQKQPAGRVFTAVATDKAGNKSKATQITFKK